VSTNLTIESPNLDKVAKEAGQFTSDAINLLWVALNDTRAELRRQARRSRETLEPKVLTLAPSASVNNLDLQDASVLSFTGSSAVNFTGMRAPDTGASRVVFVHVAGSGTITAKHNVTSETANRLSNESGADVTLSTGKGIIYIYLSGAWREVA
jgi:hypothetical protein